MKVLIDGKEVECLNDVKVIYEQEDDQGRPQELHVIANCEGLITDVFDFEGELVDTACVCEPDLFNVLSPLADE